MHLRTTALIILFSVIAKAQSSDSIVVRDLVEGDRRQQFVLLSDAEYEKKIPKRLQVLRKLPKTKHKQIDPLCLFAFEPGFRTCCNQIPTNLGGLVQAESFDYEPFLATAGLAECVGVTIFLPGKKAGLIHAGFKAVDDGILKQFLDLFEEKLRPLCEVRMKSAVLTDLTADVYEAIVRAGFKVSSVDVNDVYLECQGRTSSGTKYFPYSRLGLSEADVYDLKYRPQQVIKAFLESRALFAPEFADHYRVMVLDTRTGESCEFFKSASFPNADSPLIDLFAHMIPRMLKHDVMKHKELMRQCANKFLAHRLGLMRDKAVAALNSVDCPYSSPNGFGGLD